MTVSPSALVTGANSGLGFESAALLAEQGATRVILVSRTVEKAEAARVKLVDRVGRDPFETLAADMGDHTQIRAAVEELAKRGGQIDFLLLNAGLMASSTLQRTGEGVELTAAASLVGHHLLTMELLEAGLVTPKGRIVISGSEASRGDMPGMGLTDVPTFADANTGGDRVEAVLKMMRGDEPYKYNNMAHYAQVKVFVAWWAAALSRRLPEGMAVNAISPGNTPATNAMQHQPWIMRFVMGWFMIPMMYLFGMAQSISTAAQRYLDGAQWGPEVSGDFFASAPGKLSGPVSKVELEHLHDTLSQEASWEALVRLTNADVGVEHKRATA